MGDTQPPCVICRGVEGDVELLRTEVWQDRYWRLTTSLSAEVPGFSYLEPKRHIPYITDLDGEEARTLGVVLAYVTRALKDETGADLVYIYVFGGGVPHLHLHLAPHRPGDALNEQMVKGEVVVQQLDNGAASYASKDFPPLLPAQLRAVAQSIQGRLAGFSSS